MQKHEIISYNFDELSEKAQKKAIEAYRENIYKYGWGLEELPSLMKDTILAECEKQGIEPLDAEDVKVFYSLSYSQGDGCQFLGKFKWNGHYFSVKSGNWGNYVHSNNVVIDCLDNDGYRTEDDFEDYPYEELQKFEQEFHGVYKDVCRVAEKAGYEEIDYVHGDESIKEAITVNEYQYTEDGKRYVCL